MDKNHAYDVIIIGAGIIGTATAFALAKRGYRTLNVDKLAAAGYGSTSNSCAVIRTHYSTYQGTALAYENHFYWKNWADYLECDDERGLIKYSRTGIITISHDDSAFETYRQHHKALDIPFEDWDGPTLKEKIPQIDLRSFWPPKRPEEESFMESSRGEIPGAFFVPVGGYISDPQLSTHNIQRAAEAKGATFRFHSQVSSIDQRNDRIRGITLNDGTSFQAPVVINIAGPHSSIVNQMAGVAQNMNIQTRALRHEVHHLPAPEGIQAGECGLVVSDDDIGGYCRSEVGDALLVGSQDPQCDTDEWVDDPDNFDREVTDEQWNAQVYRMAQRIPSLPIPTHPKGIVDLYDVSDDWMPIYDKSDLSGFYMAVGTSGNQYKNAPVVGEMMASLVDACENGQDHDTDPVSITGKYTDRKIDLGFYSRLREVNEDSSFSVLG